MEFLKRLVEENRLALSLAAVLLVFVIAGFVFLRLSKKKKKRKRTYSAFFYNLYPVLKKSLISKKYIENMTRQLQKASVYTKMEVMSRSAMYFALQYFTTFIFAILGIVFFTDPVSVIFCILLSFLIPDVLIRKRIGNLYYRVIAQLAEAEESFRLNYIRYKDISVALEETKVGNRLVEAFDEIAMILTSADAELRLKKFYEDVPFLPLQTFAQICYRTEVKGDSFTSTGESNFENSLILLRSDCFQEMERLNYQHTLFGNCEFIALAGFLLIPVCEWFLEKYMPGTTLLFEGVYGYSARLVIMAVSTFSFIHISRVNSLEPFRIDDRNRMITALSKVYVIKVILAVVLPRDTSKKAARRKAEARLREAASKKTLAEFYTEKIALTGAIFIAVIMSLASVLLIGKNVIEKTTSTLSLIGTDDLSGYDEEEILALDREYMDMLNHGYTFTDEEGIKEFNILVSKHLPGLVEMQLNEQKIRMDKKYDYLTKTRFRWWFIPIAMAVSAIGWVIPDVLLKKRTKEFLEAEKEEFMQIQTFTIVLMGIGCDTQEALDYLSQLCQIHKEMFLYGFHAYTANPYAELEKMEYRTPIPEFKNYLNKMKMTIDDLSLEEAFADIAISANHLRSERNMLLRHGTETRRAQCGKYITAGFVVALVLMFMFPLLYLGYTEMMEGIANMQAL